MKELQSLSDWDEANAGKREGERRGAFITTSGRPVRRVYEPADVADLEYERHLAGPGQYPYTRGVHATGYRGRLWTTRMFAGFGSAGETNARRRDLAGTLQNDILKEFIAQKEYIFPPEPSMRLVVDTIEFGTREMPRWNTISISGYHIREAGSTAVQELAFTLADGFEYVRWCQERGLDVDEFAPRLSFFFNCHNDFFEEVAKFRAARRIWAREMKERFGAKNERSHWMRFHT